MNLKEAFRYQNKLQRLMEEAQYILAKDRNVTKVENTAMRHKVNLEAEDETTVEMPDTEYAEQITEVAVFLMFLLGEKARLSRAICTAKQSMDMDFDGEVSLNAKRQEIAGIFRHMGEIRCSENLLSGAGVGYKFNAEGNQVSYRCDLKKVTTINFDRNKVRAAFLAGGCCEDAYVDKPRRKKKGKRKSGAQYRRAMAVQHRDNRLWTIQNCACRPGAGYVDGEMQDGVWVWVGNYIKYPKNSNAKQYWKRHSNKIVRKQKEVFRGNQYRKCFDYLWTLY